MIDLIVKLITQMVSLIGVRQKREEDYFDHYVAPTYDLLQAVFGDYMKLFAELEQLAADAKDPKEIIEHLELGRMKYLAARMQLRIALEPTWEDVRELPKFEQGVLGVLHGGLAPFEDSAFNSPGQMLYRRHGHTLLDLLYRFCGRRHADITPQEFFIRSLDEQRHSIQAAYRDATEAYEELKALAHPAAAPAAQRRRRHVRRGGRLTNG